MHIIKGTNIQHTDIHTCMKLNRETFLNIKIFLNVENVHIVQNTHPKDKFQVYKTLS